MPKPELPASCWPTEDRFLRACSRSPYAPPCLTEGTAPTRNRTPLTDVREQRTANLAVSAVHFSLRCGDMDARSRLCRVATRERASLSEAQGNHRFTIVATKLTICRILLLTMQLTALREPQAKTFHHGLSKIYRYITLPYLDMRNRRRSLTGKERHGKISVKNAVISHTVSKQDGTDATLRPRLSRNRCADLNGRVIGRR